MRAKNLPVLLLAAVFALGSAGLGVAAEEKKAAETTPTPKPVVKAKYATGTVKTATSDSLTLVGKGKKELTFSVDPTTAIKKAGKSIVTTDLKEGDAVRVQYTVADGKLLAKSISVKAGGMAKQEATVPKKEETKK